MAVLFLPPSSTARKAKAWSANQYIVHLPTAAGNTLKIECPKCHSLFRVVTESKELIQDEKVDEIKVTPGERVKEVLEFLNPVGMVPMAGSAGREVHADDLTYQYRFKCKHCGYE
jgi:hypothetical protein